MSAPHLTQKLKNPDLQGAEYQQGGQLGFWNVREYVLFHDGHKCFHCGRTDVPLNVLPLGTGRLAGTVRRMGSMRRAVYRALKESIRTCP